LFKKEGAIGILEYSTIPQGIKVMNEIAKRVKITFIKAKIFPGAKYMIIMQGLHGNIEYAMGIGLEHEGLFDIGWIGQIHSHLIPILNDGLYTKKNIENVLVFQQTSHAKAIELCNMLLHKFDLSVIQVKYTEALEGHSVVILAGSIDDVYGAKTHIKCGEVITNIEAWILEEIVG
jgi:microcompartment protein CcmL/EutN